MNVYRSGICSLKTCRGDRLRTLQEENIVTGRENMVFQESAIPWSNNEVWADVVDSISAAIAGMGSEVESLKSLARHIRYEYEALDEKMERLCQNLCPGCDDVCCARATVWYDLKDLLTIYLTTDSFPPAQICRQNDLSCCHLIASGCCLNRFERPFVCTWYICPEQKELLLDKKDTSLFQAIDRLKWARNLLKKNYDQASSDGPGGAPLLF